MTINVGSNKVTMRISVELGELEVRNNISWLMGNVADAEDAVADDA